MPSSSGSFFAIISDIHANIDALDTVLADIESFPIRGIFCLGDIVGYGPEPAACVQRIMDACAVTVIGNHEAMSFLPKKILNTDWDISIRQPLQLANEQLTKAQKAWLRNQPLTANADPITLSHASLHEPPEFHYIHDDVDAGSHFAAQSTFISFNGHSHVPAIWEEDKPTRRCLQPDTNPILLDAKKRYTVNVGSVGQPRDNDHRACYALYDYEKRLLIHRRVPYDIARAQERFEKAGLPAHNARRIARGR